LTAAEDRVFGRRTNFTLFPQNRALYNIQKFSAGKLDALETKNEVAGE
jgi:hypothetical protein